MPLFTRTSARQKEIRRSKAERQATWYRRVYARLRLGPLTLLTACAVAAAVAVNTGREVPGMHAGQWVPREIPCRFTFRVENAERTRSERYHARNNAPACYTLDTSLVEDLQNRLNSLLAIAREQVADPERLRELAAKAGVSLDEPAVAELVRLAQGPDLEASHFQNAVERATQTLMRQPLVQATDVVQRRAGARAELVDPAQSTRRSVTGENLLFSNNREHVTRAVQAAAAVFATSLRPSIEQSLLALLASGAQDSFKPLYRYDPAQTARTAQEAEELVPVQYDEFPVGQPLADEGLLTPAELRNLEEEHRRYLLLLDRLSMPQFADIPGPEVGEDQPVAIFESGEPAAVFQDIRRTREFEGRRVLAMFAGARELDSFKQDRKLASWTRRARLALVFLLVFTLGGYLVVEHEQVLGRTRRRLMTALTLLLALILARQAYIYTSFPHLAVGVGAFTAMLLVIAAGRGMAYAGASLLAILLALATRQGVEFVIILVAVCLVLLVGLRNLRHRGQIIATGGFAAAVLGYVYADGQLVEAFIGFTVALVAAEFFLLRTGNVAMLALTSTAVAWLVGTLALLSGLIGERAVAAYLGFGVFAFCYLVAASRLEGIGDRRATALLFVATAAFGLVHGFGFAGFLMDTGTLGGALFVPLLGFNLGVEIGQLVIVAAALSLVWLLRDRIPRAMPSVVAAALCGVGMFWFVGRTLA